MDHLIISAILRFAWRASSSTSLKNALNSVGEDLNLGASRLLAIGIFDLLLWLFAMVSMGGRVGVGCGGGEESSEVRLEDVSYNDAKASREGDKFNEGEGGRGVRFSFSNKTSITPKSESGETEESGMSKTSLSLGETFRKALATSLEFDSTRSSLCRVLKVREHSSLASATSL